MHCVIVIVSSIDTWIQLKGWFYSYNVYIYRNYKLLQNFKLMFYLSDFS